MTAPDAIAQTMKTLAKRVYDNAVPLDLQIETLRRREVSNIIERSPRGASRTDNKCILQHLALDRLLQNPTARETAVDSSGSISGDEDKRVALGDQVVSHRIDQLEIDIEDGGVDIVVGDDGKG